MKTISVSTLKTHLSAELKKVQAGSVLTVVDHRHPVAILAPLERETLFAREASVPYTAEKLTPLMAKGLEAVLDAERADSW